MNVLPVFSIILSKWQLDSSKKILITDIQYFGSIDWIKSFNKFSHIKIEACDNWQKGGWRNRAAIAGANGRRLITVPLLGGRDQHCPLAAVKIAYKENWHLQHIRTLESCYRRAPFYEYYHHSIVEILRSRPEYLLDLNMTLLHQIRQWLFPELTISLTEKFEAQPGQEYEDRRGKAVSISPDLSGNHPVYRQVFEERHGFLPGLSILDLLFNCGPVAKTLLKDSV